MADVVTERPYAFLGSRLKRLAEQLQADAGAFAQRAGVAIPAGLHAVLATLDDAGPQSIGELARALRVSQPAMTKSVAKLAGAGLLTTRRGAADRRQSTVTLTRSGRAAVERGKTVAWPLMDAAVRELTRDLCSPLVDQIAVIEERLAARSLSDRALAHAEVTLRAARDADVPTVVGLLNRAYRSTGPDASWNSEAPYIDGDRTSETWLRQELTERANATLLIWEQWGTVLGCVLIEPLDDAVWYLGSLAVDPRLQNARAGRRLLTASEAWISGRGGREVRMRVVNVRDTLIAWYERRGYRATGETELFPYGDNRFGIPKRPDLAFTVLSKTL